MFFVTLSRTTDYYLFIKRKLSVNLTITSAAFTPSYVNFCVTLIFKTFLRNILPGQLMIQYTANVYRELQGTCRENLQYLWKRAVRITEKPYTPQKERLCMLWGGSEQGFPCVLILTGKNLFSLQGTLFSLQGSCIHYREFPVRISTQGNPCSHYREWVCSVVIIGFSPQSVNITGFPHNIHNLSL